MIYKRCPRCGKRICEGTKCSCQKLRHREYDRYTRDKRSKSFYSSKEWTDTQSYVLNELDDGIDVYVYMTDGKIIPADTVHHIIPLRDDWDKRIDTDNLISLSHDTHSAIEQQYRRDKPYMIELLSGILKKFRKKIEEGAV